MIRAVQRDGLDTHTWPDHQDQHLTSHACDQSRCLQAVHTSIQVCKRVPRNPGLTFWMCVCSIYSRHSSTMLPQTPFATLLGSWAWCGFVPRPNFMQTVEDQVSNPTACRPCKQQCHLCPVPM